ncbi:MAG: hypothetical protein CV087_24365 [Candidatus Brocadia sp. WS118]|nr:MAG: hypothetical protein CV087_24365 [Candidatus Brocadia sp. WS118]
MEPLRFFADECVFGLTVNLLKKSGFTVIRAQDIGMAGTIDQEIFEKAQQLKSLLITNDQGFLDIRQYPPSSHYGIIVLKMLPDPTHVKLVHQVLKTLLALEQQFEGTLFIVDGNKYRKRTMS